MRVLAIGDVHEPVSREGYFEFCKDIYKAWDCNAVVFLGDLVDWHGISFHAAHPEGPGVCDEFELALAKVQKWYEAFPNATVCIGNHDERVVRLAEVAHIPAKFLRAYSDIWQTPGWDWVYDKIIDDTYYIHGTACGGEHPAYNMAKQMSMSVVMGHTHKAAGVKWIVNPHKRWFGMDTGCGVDDKAYAFAYGRHLKRRSVIGCGVVLDGIPYHEIMDVENY